MAIAATLLFLIPLAGYLYSSLRWNRFKQFAHAPQPTPSLLWGHLRVINDQIQSFPDKPNRHPGESGTEMISCSHATHTGCSLLNSPFALEEVFRELGAKLGASVFVMDMRPVTDPMLVIGEHSVAEQVSRSTKTLPYSFPKSPTYNITMDLLGYRSILSRDVRLPFLPKRPLLLYCWHLSRHELTHSLYRALSGRIFAEPSTPVSLRSI